MKLITFKTKTGESKAGLLTAEGVVDLASASNGQLPGDILSFIDRHEANTKLIKALDLENAQPDYALSDVTLLAPLPNPRSFRDYISFEQHLKNASATFGHQVAPEWYEMPIFYFTRPVCKATAIRCLPTR